MKTSSRVLKFGGDPPNQRLISTQVEVVDDEGLLFAPADASAAPPLAGEGFTEANGFLRDCRRLIDWPWLAAVAEDARLPRLSTLYLLAGARGGTSPLHYDMRANFFCMVSGRKRVFLAPPDAWPRLRPWPVTSALDRRARVSAADLGGGAGAVAVTLEPGEALFIPPFWFHDVQQIDATTLSLAFWFLSEPPLDRRARALRLARDVEQCAADAAGERGAADLLLRAAGPEADDDDAACRAIRDATKAEPPGFLASVVAGRLFGAPPDLAAPEG